MCSSNLHKHFWTEHCCCPDLHGFAYNLFLTPLTILYQQIWLDQILLLAPSFSQMMILNQRYVSHAYGECFPFPTNYTPLPSSWTNLVVLWSLVFGKSGKLRLVACLHLLATSSWSYLMYGVSQFHWFSHTMILWGQMDAMGFLL
jgi:hypothetical protein